MSDETKFYRLTKPMKFRTLKLISQSAGHTYEVGIKRVSYLINNILYKLNKLTRYTNKDIITRHLDFPHDYDKEVVVTPLVMAFVTPQIFEEKTIDLDYFRRKDGDITYVISDKSETRLFLECKLTDIQLNVAGNWYSASRLPKFKASVDSEEGFNVMNFDTMKLKKMETKHILGIDVELEQISEAQLNYYYELAVKEFKKALESIELKDLMIKG